MVPLSVLRVGFPSTNSGLALSGLWAVRYKLPRRLATDMGTTMVSQVTLPGPQAIFSGSGNLILIKRMLFILACARELQDSYRPGRTVAGF